VRDFGRLDIVVNNAGYQQTHESLDDIPLDELERTFRTNVFGTFHLTQEAMKVLNPGGVILNTASIQAYEPSPELVAYAATKAAIVNLTKSTAKLAMQQGVGVNAIAPGPVWTPLIPATMSAEKVKTFGENTVFGRPAQPIEIASVFVSSPLMTLATSPVRCTEPQVGAPRSRGCYEVGTELDSLRHLWVG
jgi:NAD(P)-dependent dehydrogenase (short-subunit alcohol dehydrogenase family)